MSQETITLSAEKRDAQGTRAVRRLRSEGKLPAVVYGHGEGAVNISLPTKETVREINAGHAVFDLNIDGKSESVLLKDVQYNYLGDEILHLDFFRVNLGEEVTTDVPLVLTGEAAGAKEGGVLTQTRDNITVVCKVRDLPDELKHDISAMNVGDALHVSEIALPSGVSLPEGDVDFTIATVAVNKRAQAAADELENETGAEPEIIGKDGDAEKSEPEQDA